MAKLTNMQMQLLAGRVVDLLEEQHKEANADVTRTLEYINFEKTYDDDILHQMRENDKILKNLQEIIDKTTAQKDLLRTQIQEVAKEYNIQNTSYWSKMDASEFIQKYIAKQKEEKFASQIFDREKMLRRVQTDMLLSDTGNTEELIRSLVAKY